MTTSTPGNPFAKSKAKPGEGEIILSLLPPGKQVLTAFEYQYPLKLISPDPHIVAVTSTDHTSQAKASANETATANVPVTTVFLLTYGGGLLAGDNINLTITLDPHTRLALLTQGSTKIFKAKEQSLSASTTATLTSFSNPAPLSLTRQTLNVKISPHAALCYLPDPNQPYARSTYIQHQTFYTSPYGSSSLLFLDWVSEGRSARGEHWDLTSWRGRTEVREFDESSNSPGRLLIRDSLQLFSDDVADLRAKTAGHGIVGTLIIYGPVFGGLGEFIMKEFRALPRIGAKNWAPPPKTPTIIEEEGEGSKDYFGAPAPQSPHAHHRNHKHGPTTQSSTSPMPGGAHKHRADEHVEGLLWTAAPVRGFVIVKFGAPDVDGARRWLGEMLRQEGTVEREFGHQALLCLR